MPPKAENPKPAAVPSAGCILANKEVTKGYMTYLLLLTNYLA